MKMVKEKEIINNSTYKNVKEQSECKRQYENGQIELQCFYKDGKKGEYKQWFDNGRL